VLLTGYRAELIEQFASEAAWPHDTEIICLDTGENTPTGGRVHNAASVLENQRFCLTYADGVADIDLHALLAEHERHTPQATMTVVRPELQFGVAEFNGDGFVRGFAEKPRSEHWVNGGFFCFEPAALDTIPAESILERGPLEQLAAAGQLRAFKHEGFWECMDTYKDAVALNDLWESGAPPWHVL
jgi:glucose-1-phosphate cytidylyltransferase